LPWFFFLFLALYSERLNTRRLSIYYRLALVAIALVLAISHYLTQDLIDNQRYDAAEISISGRQRMLSQRLTKNVLLLAQQPANTPEAQHYCQEIRRNFAEFERAWHGLQYGDSALFLDNTSTPEIARQFEILKPLHQQLVDQLHALQDACGNPQLDQQALAQAITPGLLAIEQAYLKAMEEIVKRYTFEANDKHSRLDRWHWIFLIIALLILIAEALFIFRPAIKKVQDSIDIQQQFQARLQLKNHALDQLNQQLQAQNLALEKAGEALRKSHEQLDQFAYIISHDLKAPLRACSNLVDWLQEDLAANENQEVKKHLNLLKDRANRMTQMIDAVLKYSRAIRAQGEKEWLDLNQEIPQWFAQLSPPAHVKLTLAADFPQVASEKIAMQQVFMNLLSNALRYAMHDKLHIQIGWETAEAGYTFWLEDNGPGIDSAYFDKIFELFQTANSQHSDSSGIGLSVVKKIIEDHGGQIHATHSRSGQGLRFEIYWPITADPR
jgi:signal transduction histidine kinase